MHDDSKTLVKLVILDADRRLLLQASESTLQLPNVIISRFTRIAHAVTKAALELWGMRLFAIVSASIDSESDKLPADTELVLVCRLQQTDGPHEGFLWHDSKTASLSLGDHAWLDAGLAELKRYDSGVKASNFGRYSSLDSLRTWYSPTLAAMGLKETSIEQWNGDAWFSLFRINTETVDRDSAEAAKSFWFKAVGEPNTREYAVTVALTAECPYWFPRLVATKPEVNGWLMEEVHGHELDAEADGRPWALTARVLAKVQKRFVGQEERLLELGCRDWRMPQVLAALDPFFEDMEEIMQRQVNEPPRILDRSELRSLKVHCQDLCRRIEDVDIPYTITHGDFSPHNVLVSNGWPILIDWAEAYVGFPFISWEYFWNRMIKDHPEHAAWHERMHRNYAYRVWAPMLGQSRVDAALRLSPAMAVLNLALYGIDSPEQRQNRRADKSKRSLVRRLHRELNILHNAVSEPVGAL
jgi:hypothetical protein